MIENSFLIGVPYTFENDILIYPPKVMDVASRKNYFKWVKILTMSQEEIEDELAKVIQDNQPFPTPLEFLLNNCYHSKEYRALAEESFMFFTHLKCNFIFSNKMIILGDLKEEIEKVTDVNDLKIINEDNFFDFQNIIRGACGEKEVEPPNPHEDPRIKRIKAKARLRDRIKAKSGQGLKLNSIITAICCMGIGITPLNIGEVSYAAINPIVQTYQEKEKYEIDIRSLQAGADSKKIKPKYWIRNLD